MQLPVMPFVAPMLAKPAKALPEGHCYEPKWDGFRCIIFRDGDDVLVASRDEKDLTYCFPEVVEYAKAQLPDRIVVDGELIIVTDDRLNFEGLGSRIRPRSEEGRPSLMARARELPTQFVAFDLLACDDRPFIDEPYSTRREWLERALVGAEPPVHLTPMTGDADIALAWFKEFEGAGLDGLISKDPAAPYSPGARTMLKLKHSRTADVVVAGWREHKSTAPDGSPLLGSLLLGVYDDEGRLHHLGVCAAFTAAKRAKLVAELAPLEVHSNHPWIEPAEGTRAPGGQSRWTGGRDLSFHALDPHRVVEIGFDALQGDRLRHTATFVRWRPDRDPTSCLMDQFDRPAEFSISAVLAAGHKK